MGAKTQIELMKILQKIPIFIEKNIALLKLKDNLESKDFWNLKKKLSCNEGPSCFEYQVIGKIATGKYDVITKNVKFNALQSDWGPKLAYDVVIEIFQTLRRNYGFHHLKMDHGMVSQFFINCIDSCIFSVVIT